MILRLVSGPMLEKKNKTGPLADRQKVLPTARLRASLFLGFSTTRATGNFQKIFWEPREIFGIPRIFGIAGIQEIPENFREKFFELDYFYFFF